MTSMVLGDYTLESLTPSVNAPIILKVHKSLHIILGAGEGRFCLSIYSCCCLKE
jgi:hypothetical protein